MQAMILEKPGPIETSPLRLVELDKPEPGPDEVRLRVRACGVCRTDLHIVEADLDLPILPIVPGHQVVGKVDRIGEGVESSWLGRRVGVAWVNTTCGSCRYCRSERTNLCDHARFTGFHLNGGFAEWIVTPAASVYPLPDGFDDVEAAPLLCAGIIGYRALEAAGARRVRRLGLYGFGGSAHIALQIARYWGCDVYVATRGEHHQEQARRLGAVWAGKASSIEDGSLEAAVLFAPSGGLVPVVLRALSKGATLAIAGIHLSQIPPLDYALLHGERVIRSVANSTRADGEACLRLGAEIPIQTGVERFDLADANEALARMKASKLHKPAAVVEMA